MAKFCFWFLTITLSAYRSVASECESGWKIYKDETCIKTFDDLLTYEEAQQFCASQATDDGVATLVMVKEPDMQELLANYTADNFENLWLGAKFDNEAHQYKWEDGDSLSYTNWAEGYPRDISSPNVCIQLRPANAKSTITIEGKWENAVCQRRSLVICQQPSSWSLKDATQEILKLRRELVSTNSKLESVESNLFAVSSELQNVNARVVPVGSLYVQYYGQPSP